MGANKACREADPHRGAERNDANWALSERSRARSGFRLSRSELRFSGSETEDPGSEETLQDGGGVRVYGWELGSARKESRQVRIQTVRVGIKITQVRIKIFQVRIKIIQVRIKIIQVRKKIP